MAPDAPVDVLVGGGGGGGAGVECVGVGTGVVCVVDPPPEEDFVVEPDDELCGVEPEEVVERDPDDPLEREEVEALDDDDVDDPAFEVPAATGAGAPPVSAAAWAWSAATDLRRALTWAELAAMACWSATTCGSVLAAGAAAGVELPVVAVTGW